MCRGLCWPVNQGQRGQSRRIYAGAKGRASDMAHRGGATGGCIGQHSKPHLQPRAGRPFADVRAPAATRRGDKGGGWMETATGDGTGIGSDDTHPGRGRGEAQR